VASPESELLAAARSHAPDAWDLLLKRHQLPLYTYVAEMVGDRTAALDLVQETFARAIRHIGSLQDDAKFASWLFSIAHQQCLQHWRRTQRERALFEEDDTALDPAFADEPDPRALLIQREQAEALFALVARLPPAQRSALLLHIVEDFPLDEIAAITGIPLGTVKSRLHHAKRALQTMIRHSP